MKIPITRMYRATLIVAAALLLPAAGHAEEAALRVLAPAGGEIWPKGTTQTVRWRAPDSVARVDLHLWHAIVCVTQPCEQRPSALYTIATDAPNTGRFEWVVPSLLQEIGLPPAGRYFVRVRNPITGAVADSPASFFIVGELKTKAGPLLPVRFCRPLPCA